MQASNKKLPIVQQMNIARDIGLGMEYLSALGFIHGVRLILAYNYTVLYSTVFEKVYCTYQFPFLLLHTCQPIYMNVVLWHYDNQSNCENFSIVGFSDTEYACFQNWYVQNWWFWTHKNNKREW